jgi:hypothetical protein
MLFNIPQYNRTDCLSQSCTIFTILQNIRCDCLSNIGKMPDDIGHDLSHTILLADYSLAEFGSEP